VLFTVSSCSCLSGRMNAPYVLWVIVAFSEISVCLSAHPATKVNSKISSTGIVLLIQIPSLLYPLQSSTSRVTS